MVPVPSAATVPAAAVEVVANHPAAVGQGTGRVGPHRSAAEGITAHALTGDSLEVGPREFARPTRKSSGTEIPDRTTVERASAIEPSTPIERATAVKPTASIERATAVDAATIDAAITAEVAGAAAKITSAEVPTAKVAAAAPEVAAASAKVTTTAAKSSATHRPTAAAEASAAMTATAAVRPRDRRGGHLADDRDRHDQRFKPLSRLHQPMHRVFSETSCGHELFQQAVVALSEPF